MPHEIERGAVELIGAGFRNDVDGCGGMVTVARRQRTRFDLEFLECIGKRRRKVEVVERIVMRPAIHDVGDAVGGAAGNRDRRGGIVLVRLKVGRRRRRRQAREQDQLGRLSAVQRELGDALVVDDLSDAGASRLDERRLAVTIISSLRTPSFNSTLS